MSLSSILARQIAWAGARPRRDHVLESIGDNFFVPLHTATYAELAQGSGNELGFGKGTAKMRSLRSSSVLACNVFDPWRGHGLAPLARAMSVDDSFTDLAFEQKLPHGLPSYPPNLDVMLFGRRTAPIGIEAKYAEPYDKPKARAPLQDKYFPRDQKRWASLGLPSCQALAEAIGHDVQFKHLDAGQLLKHTLGLATVFGHLKPIRLRYVWFDCRGDEDNAHREELLRFARSVGDDIDFGAISYQELFARLKAAPEPQPGYFSYLAARYFSE